MKGSSHEKEILNEKFSNKITAGKARKRRERVVQGVALQLLGITGLRR